jgi:hypothetical protein
MRWEEIATEDLAPDSTNYPQLTIEGNRLG